MKSRLWHKIFKCSDCTKKHSCIQVVVVTRKTQVIWLWQGWLRFGGCGKTNRYYRCDMNDSLWNALDSHKDYFQRPRRLVRFSRMFFPHWRCRILLSLRILNDHQKKKVWKSTNNFHYSLFKSTWDASTFETTRPGLVAASQKTDEFLGSGLSGKVFLITFYELCHHFPVGEVRIT